MVFPDEDDDDNIGIRTRSGKKLSVSPTPAIQSTSNSAVLQKLNALAKWKQSTLCFNKCANERCDPLGKFLNYGRANTCKRCRVVRKLLQNELILMYDKEELENTLLNYLYFHVIKVFDTDADQHYAKNRPHHPYYVAYSQFREFKRLLTTNIVSSFSVPISMQSAALRPFIFRTKLCTELDIEQIGRTVSCELCTGIDAREERPELAHQFALPAVLVTISGRRYLRHDFQFVNNNNDIFEPQQFLLCKMHFPYFNCLYKLTHMDWNVHLNFRHRVAQLLAQNPGMNAEQTINGIEPTVFSKLIIAYMPTIRFLNLNCAPFSNTFSGRVEWMRFNVALKNEAILKKVAGMAYKK